MKKSLKLLLALVGFALPSISFADAGDPALNIATTSGGVDKYILLGWRRFPQRPILYNKLTNSSIYADWYNQ